MGYGQVKGAHQALLVGETLGTSAENHCVLGMQRLTEVGEVLILKLAIMRSQA